LARRFDIDLSKADKDKLIQFIEETGSEEKGYDQLVRYKCLTDLYFLGSEVLGMGAANRKGSPLLDPVFHRWLCRELSKDVMSKLIIVPRGHLKTAWVLVKVIQEILKDPNIRIHIYSITQKFVEDHHMKTIKVLLQTPYLRYLFPSIVLPRKEWETDTQKLMLMCRDTEKGQVVSGGQIEVYGSGNTVTGRRADLQIFDDILDKTTVRTEGGIISTREWFSGVQPILEPGGEQIMIGTPYHYSDLYYTVQDEELFESVIIRKCKENGKWIYKWWNQKRYKQFTKSMLPYDEKAQMWCDPMPVEDMAFPPPQPVFDKLPDEELVYYAAVDPAGTTETYSDETAIVVAAVTADGRVYVVEAQNGKWPGPEISRRIIDVVLRYSPRKVGIEFGQQEHLKFILDNSKSEWEQTTGNRLQLWVEPIKLSNKRSKFDRVNWTLGSWVKQNKCWIHKSCVNLIDQMGRFNKNYTGRDDLVDAAAMIFQIVDIFSYRFYTKEEFKHEPKGYFTFEETFGELTEPPKAWESLFA
jgi:hypothetical protein